MRKRGILPPLAIAFGFFVLLWVGVIGGWMNPLLVWPYGLLSVLALILYALDKRAAQRDQRRIPEINLHLVSLFGGWPGALVARHWLRHKTRKQPFRTIFWAIVVINSALLILLFTSLGNQQLMSWLDK